MSLAALLLVGCTGGGDDDLLEVDAAQEPQPEETEDPEPEPEETEDPEPEPEDSYAVPDEIDEAYVERVINAILEVQSEVLRGALQKQQGENLSEELIALHFSTTEGNQRLDTMEEYQRYIDDPESRNGLLDAPELGTMRFRAIELVHAEPDRCLIVVGNWDRSEVSAVADPEQLVAFSLSRLPTDQDVSEGNPTPWQWRGNTVMVDTDDNPIPQEYWGELDYSSVLDTSCEAL
jgi:hypothetical protein